ncbi:MAG: hypothetical protein RBT36_01380 [Desulfobulbus sp.]|nr:hypothetical protein [Desulfobulbus sp.]
MPVAKALAAILSAICSFFAAPHLARGKDASVNWTKGEVLVPDKAIRSEVGVVADGTILDVD